MPFTQPHLLIFGGPNGSGKSTIKSAYEGRIPEYFINADEITKDYLEGRDFREFSSDELRDLNYCAARTADALRWEALEQGISFATESVMSTDKMIKFMQAAKKMGYQVHLIYVTTFDPEINIDRVETRVQDGGHPVPPEKIRDRYYRAMEEFLPQAIRIADKADVYNNSFEAPSLILEKTHDKINLFPQPEPSKWNEKTLQELVYFSES